MKPDDEGSIPAGHEGGRGGNAWQTDMARFFVDAARRHAWGDDLGCCRPEDLVDCLWHYYEAAIEAVDDRSAAELAFNDCKRTMPSSRAFAALFVACSSKMAPADLLVVACREAARVSGRKPAEVLGRACVDVARESDDPDSADMLRDALGTGKDALPILSEALWCLLDETADDLLGLLAGACGRTAGDPADSAALADGIGDAFLEAADGLGGSRHVAGSLMEELQLGIRELEDADPLVEALEAAMGEINDPRVLLGSLFDACTDFITVGSSIWFPTHRANVWEACCRTLSATSGPMATTKVLLKAVEDATRRDWNLDPGTRALVKALTQTTAMASEPAAVVPVLVDAYCRITEANGDLHDSAFVLLPAAKDAISEADDPARAVAIMLEGLCRS